MIAKYGNENKQSKKYKFTSDNALSIRSSDQPALLV